MSDHRYSAASIRADLLRAAIGAGICGFPLLVVDAGIWVQSILSILTILFCLFGIRTILRSVTVINADADGIRLNNGKRLAWNEMNGFKLSYFSTRRDRSNGWMQLKVTGPDIRMSFDSNLSGFNDLSRLAWRAAQANDVPATDATLSNLQALGILADTPRTPENGPQSDRDTGWGNPANWRQ